MTHALMLRRRSRGHRGGNENIRNAPEIPRCSRSAYSCRTLTEAGCLTSRLCRACIRGRGSSRWSGPGARCLPNSAHALGGNTTALRLGWPQLVPGHNSNSFQPDAVGLTETICDVLLILCATDDRHKRTSCCDVVVLGRVGPCVSPTLEPDRTQGCCFRRQRSPCQLPETSFKAKLKPHPGSHVLLQRLLCLQQRNLLLRPSSRPAACCSITSQDEHPPETPDLSRRPELRVEATSARAL